VLRYPRMHFSLWQAGFATIVGQWDNLISS